MAITSYALTTTPTAIFTSSGTSVITAMYYCNIDPSTANAFSVWLVQNGGVHSNTNVIYNNVAVVAKDTYVVDREKIVLENGDSIYAYGNVNNVISATISSFAQ
jgi:hypothetical protein